MAILEDIAEALQTGRKKQVVPLVQQAIDAGVPATDILNKGLVAGMDVMGEKFKNDEVFVPQVLASANAMNAGTALLKPLLADAGTAPIGRAVIGTTKGDMHDIGKNIVRMMVEGKGIQITDLGVDVAAEDFVNYVKGNPDCGVVMISSLLTTTMPGLGDTVEAFKDAGLRDKVTIMVGGAPVTQDYCDKIGADIYTDDAGSAAQAAAAAVAK